MNSSKSSLCIFFGLRWSFPSLPWDFAVLHNDPAGPQDHCGRCQIQTWDLCPRSLLRYQWANTSHIFKQITCFLWAKERSTHEKEQITPVALLWWTTWANYSYFLFCKDLQEWFAHICFFVKSNKSESPPLLFKKMTEQRATGGICSFFIVICSNHKWITYNALFKRAMRASCSGLFLCQEQWEQINHSHSFVKSNKSNSLTVALFKEWWEQIAHSCSVIWAILSKRVQSERAKSKRVKSERAKSEEKRV